MFFQRDDLCQFWTHDSLDNTCFLKESCSNYFDCDTCTTGQKDCGLNEDFTKLMVVGGDGSEFVNFDVEVIDLSSTDTTCFKTRACPLRSSSIGTFTNGEAFVCESYQDVPDCYFYSSKQGIIKAFHRFIEKK